MVSATDKPAEAVLLWKKNIVLWLISLSEQVISYILIW
jgi:hypothetical protein